MSASSPEPFDNDDANDLLSDLVSGNTLKPIQSAFDEAFANEYIEDDSGATIIAAGEVVALLRGKPGQSLPEALTAWHDTNSFTIDDTVVVQATQAVRMVYEASGLREQWEEYPDDFAVWEQGVLDLLSRLQASTPRTAID